jgi:hypothetical protein
MKAYFQNIESVIAEQLLAAQKSIKVAVCWFVNDRLFQLLLKKQEDVSVSLIIDYNEINFNPKGLNFQELQDLGAEVYVMTEGSNRMHHKFCVIDDFKVITGSYNWTYKAEKINFENIVISDSQEIASPFIESFSKIADLCTTEIPEKIKDVNLTAEILTELNFHNQYLLLDNNTEETKTVTDNVLLLVTQNEKANLLFDITSNNNVEDLEELFNVTKNKLFSLFFKLEKLKDKYSFLVKPEMLIGYSLEFVKRFNVAQLEKFYSSSFCFYPYDDLVDLFELKTDYLRCLNKLLNSDIFFSSTKVLKDSLLLFSWDCSYKIFNNPNIFKLYLNEGKEFFEQILNHHYMCNWKYNGLIQNPFLIDFPEILESYIESDRWNWDAFVKNTSLLDHPEIIEKYCEDKKWKWELFVQNPALMDYPKLIEKYYSMKGWSWESFAQNPALLNHPEIIEKYCEDKKWPWESFVQNPALLNHAEIIEKYCEDKKWKWESFSKNPSLILFPEIINKYFDKIKIDKLNLDEIFKMIHCGGIEFKNALKKDQNKLKLYPIQIQSYLKKMFK